ncbi:hypothetical protein COU61_04445 [Candidatus Pacearchaeota archaeon CG10_big_fil_rev_8_21_14_0_10_35_13]|nr:MAG: hypothetical protein COU61_04445 [Candidatus Pacearchaeota archaeon CG10_big_fil_rev_8_21_14_0_10_35_13]
MSVRSWFRYMYYDNKVGIGLMGALVVYGMGMISGISKFSDKLKERYANHIVPKTIQFRDLDGDELLKTRTQNVAHRLRGKFPKRMRTSVRLVPSPVDSSYDADTALRVLDTIYERNSFSDDDRYYKLGQMVTNVLKSDVSVILMRNPYELSPTETVNRLGRFFIENYNIEGFKDMVKRSD